MEKVFSRLLDFLYADHERVASFLAQIEGRGSLKESATAGTQQSKEGKKAGLKLGIAEGNLGSEREWGKEVRLTYDPLWANSRKLIDYFEKEQDLSEFTLGQLRVITGNLIAYDFSAISSMMNAESMVDFIARGVSGNDDDHSRKKPQSLAEKKKEAVVIRELMRGLPLGIGFILVSETSHFWFSVKREYLSLYDLDIPFKFPTHVSGIWSVLGVIDALPSDHVEGLQRVIQKNIDGLMPSMALNMMQITGAIVGMFGRPLPAYGLSPLVVYREVNATESEAS